jgi:peptide/nickel transport system permease protein
VTVTGNLAEMVVAPARAGILARAPWLMWMSLGFLAIVVLMALLGPRLAPADPNAVDLLNAYAPVGGGHLLGTDDSGRDILSRIIVGSRLSLLGPAVVAAVSAVLGVGLGIAAAWCGGWVDTVVSRVFDLIFSFPGLLFAIIVVALVGPGFWAPVVALAVAYTPSIGRVVRAAAMRERALPYVAAARVQGFSSLWICVRNILPNVFSLISVQTALSFGYALIDLAAISFLGLGVQPPTAEWGLMVADGQPAILQGAPEQSMFASAVIVLTVISVNLVGEGLSRRSRGRA